MKFTCTRSALLDPLLIASAVAPTRSVKPVLQTVRLDASEDFVEIQGTDLETSVRIRVRNVDVKDPGACLLPAARLSSIMRELDEGEITLDTDQLLCRIESPGASFRMQGGNPDEFPEVTALAHEGDDKLIQVPAAAFRQMTRKTAFAVSAEKTRYALNGILFTLGPGKLRMVATDGRRLASVEFEGDFEGVQEDSAILPPKAVQQLDRVLTPEDEFVGLKIEEGHLLMRTLRATIAARLIEGSYPSLESIIPPPGEVRLELDRNDFVSAVRKAAIMTSEESKPVRLSINSDRLVISARSSDLGDAVIELPLDGPSEGFDIGFNPTYLMDGFRAMDSEKVTLEVTAPNRGGRVVGDPGYLYVIMPISLG